VKAFGHMRLDEITTEEVQRLKAALTERAPKTVNNILTTLTVVLRTAVEWGVIARVPCAIKLLKAPKGEASFYDFDEFERLVKAAQSESLTQLLVLPGGEAGLGAASYLRDARLSRFRPLRSAAIKASFFARVQPLICRSRARASSIEVNTSESTSATGRRAAVY
jgi:hypothetical protein